MPRILPKNTPVATQKSLDTRATQKQASMPRIQGARVGWTPQSAGNRGSPAPAAKAFVDAFAQAGKARSQMEMVQGSVDINDAADSLLRQTASELASQLSDRGLEKEAGAVTAQLEQFFKQAGPAKHYYVDPERGSMAALEDNGERQDKVMAQLTALSQRLETVNAEPNGENQQAYNRHASGQSTAREAQFAVAFQQAYHSSGADEKMVRDTQRFFTRLPARVESQIESRGGSLEPLERAGATSRALEEMIRKFQAAGG